MTELGGGGEGRGHGLQKTDSRAIEKGKSGKEKKKKKGSTEDGGGREGR